MSPYLVAAIVGLALLFLMAVIYFTVDPSSEPAPAIVAPEAAVMMSAPCATAPGRFNKVMLKNRARDNYCLEAPSGEDRLKGSNCTGEDSQRFSLDEKGQLRVQATGKCVDVTSTADGTFITQQVCNGTAAQQWFRTDDGNLQSVLGDICINNNDGDDSVMTWKCASVPKQQWDPMS